MGAFERLSPLVAELRDAGADHVALLTLDGDPWCEASLGTLRALAPAP